MLPFGRKNSVRCSGELERGFEVCARCLTSRMLALLPPNMLASCTRFLRYDDGDGEYLAKEPARHQDDTGHAKGHPRFVFYVFGFNPAAIPNHPRETIAAAASTDSLAAAPATPDTIATAAAKTPSWRLRSPLWSTAANASAGSAANAAVRWRSTGWAAAYASAARSSSASRQLRRRTPPGTLCDHATGIGSAPGLPSTATAPAATATSANAATAVYSGSS